jgi:DNA repair photolyase
LVGVTDNITMTQDRSDIKGRGAGFNPGNRFAQWSRETWDDGWEAQRSPPLRTLLTRDSSRSALAWNQSPDVPFDRSLNPYRGCEHGCIYCYARPSHARLGLSPGLDFESRLFHKPDAPELLRRELARPGYRCRPVALSGNTDAYQPVEREQGISRRLLEVLWEHRHPLLIVTKSALVERDLDRLQEFAREDLVRVCLSLTTLDPVLARSLEPRASSPLRRLRTLKRLSAAGIPVGVLVAPVIPAVTDAELEQVLRAARQAGALWARYVMLRLPLEVEPLFRDWLERHLPERAAKVLGLVADCHGGRTYDARFGHRMSGSGAVADLIAQRFRLAANRLGYAEPTEPDSSRFRVPGQGVQLELL